MSIEKNETPPMYARHIYEQQKAAGFPTPKIVAHIQIFRWTEKDGTEHRWSVDMARALIQAKGLQADVPIDRELAADALVKNDDESVVDKKHAEQADLDEPIIVIEHVEKSTNDTKHIIIDGWHRIYRFVKLTNRQEPLMAFVLTQAEANQIKIK